MIEKLIVGLLLAIGYCLAIFRPELLSSDEMKAVVSYDGLALIAVMFTITTATAIAINAKSLEIVRKLADSEKVYDAARDLRKTMRRNTMIFFFSFVVAFISFFILNVFLIIKPLPLLGIGTARAISIFSSLCVMNFLAALVLGFYIVLDVYRVTFGLLETEASISRNG